MGIFDKVKQAAELNKVRTQAKAFQQQLEAQTIELDENGIRVVISGDMKIKELSIDGSPNQRVLDTLNKGLKKSQEMSGGLGGLMKMMGN